MKLKEPENKNYAATVVEIRETHPLEGLDNLVGTNLIGCQAVISRDVPIGTIGVVFGPETQLSEEFARLNNLHRHGDRNDDHGQSGFLEDNRRVRAIRLRGHRSDGLFMPMSSLRYAGASPEDLQVGDTFDELNGHPICNKYVVKRKASQNRLEKNKNKFTSRVDKKFIPDHYDTENYFRSPQTIPENKWVYITQKLHGTSIRVGHTFVSRQLTIRDRLAKKVGVDVKDTEMDYVFGSRRSIKDVNNPNQNHFYSTDIYTEEGKKLEGLLPENYIVYGELIGWTKEGAELQKNYTYDVPAGTSDLYVYRVAIVNGQGVIVDLTWPQVEEFCRDRNIKTVPLLYDGPMPKEEEIRLWFIDKRFRDDGYPQAVPLSEGSPVDEGVCIRLDGLAPFIQKAKSPQFLEHETKMLDEGVEDIETEES